MKTQEKALFRALCAFKSSSFDERLLQSATPHVLGQLFFNRMQGVAYDTLKKHGLSGRVNREFRHSLEGAYEQNIRKNRSFLQCVKEVAGLLEAGGCTAAMLKGALLCGLYPEGCRTASDIDLLVLPADVTAVGKVLSAGGFRQGNVRNGIFVPAERREIIESRMMRGETVPYIKEVNLPGMRFLEVDINFSLDYKNSDETALKAMLEAAVCRDMRGVRIPTLCREDFLLHLCGHLYKEAATLPWVEMNRDMTLYKYADIYMLLHDLSEKDAAELFDRARELEMEKICGFAIEQTAALLGVPDAGILAKAEQMLEGDRQFLHEVISPAEGKRYRYRTQDIAERFFMDNRAADLQEVREK